MDDSQMLYFPEHRTVVARRGSVFSESLVVPADLVCGFNCHFWGELVVEGELLLGPHCTVGEGVRARRGIIGYRTVVDGDVTMEGDVRVLDGVEIKGQLSAGGRVLLRPDVALRGIRGAQAVETIGD